MRFRNLNNSCVRISSGIDVFEPSDDDYRLFHSKPRWQMFLLASGRHICAPWDYTDLASFSFFKHFFGYLHQETTHRPESLRDCLNIHISFHLFDLDSVEWFWWMVLMWQWKQAILLLIPLFFEALGVVNKVEKKISPLLLKKVRKEFERVARLLCCQDESRKCGELHNMFDPRILHASHFGVRGKSGYEKLVFHKWWISLRCFERIFVLHLGFCIVL